MRNSNFMDHSTLRPHTDAERNKSICIRIQRSVAQHTAHSSAVKEREKSLSIKCRIDCAFVRNIIALNWNPIFFLSWRRETKRIRKISNAGSDAHTHTFSVHTSDRRLMNIQWTFNPFMRIVGFMITKCDKYISNIHPQPHAMPSEKIHCVSDNKHIAVEWKPFRHFFVKSFRDLSLLCPSTVHSLIRLCRFHLNSITLCRMFSSSVCVWSSSRVCCFVSRSLFFNSNSFRFLCVPLSISVPIIETTLLISRERASEKIRLEWMKSILPRYWCESMDWEFFAICP